MTALSFLGSGQIEEKASIHRLKESESTKIDGLRQETLNVGKETRAIRNDGQIGEELMEEIELLSSLTLDMLPVPPLIGGSKEERQENVESTGEDVALQIHDAKKEASLMLYHQSWYGRSCHTSMIHLCDNFVSFVDDVVFS